MRTYTSSLSIFLILIVGFSFLVHSCSTKPDDLIEEETYIVLLAEMELLNIIRTQDRDPEKTFEMFLDLLKSYNITEEQFYSSHEWYQKQVEEQIVRYRAALDILNEEYGFLNQTSRERDERAREQAEREAVSTSE